MTSFLKGALAGAAIGFLYAPKRGEETRARVRSEIEALLERAEQGLRDIGADLTDQLAELRERAAAAVDGERDGHPGG